MSKPADASVSIAAVDTWPPPPTSAPVTYTLGGLAVTKTNDRLTVYDAKVKRLAILSWSVLTGTLAITWLIGFYMCYDAHQIDGQPGPVWDDPAFHIIMVPNAIMDASLSVLLAVQHWLHWRAGYNGNLVFVRQLRVVQKGRSSGLVEAVHYWSVTANQFVGPILWHTPTHHVRFIVENQKRSSPLSPWHCVMCFRHPEDAVRLAQEIGQFLDVPVREEVSVSGGRGHP